MSGAEFDAIAADYHAQHVASIRLSGEDPDFFAQYKARIARDMAQQAGCAPGDILDFGSGIGNAVMPLLAHFPHARLTCLDVSSQSLSLSRQRHGSAPSYRNYDGRQLPDDLGSFDLIFTACVFHHIPADQHVALLAQLKRVLRPGGILVLFEHNPWNPLTRRAVKACPFDADAVLIAAPEMRRRVTAAGFKDCKVDYRMFFPAFLAGLRPIERLLTRIPIGAQYSVRAR